MTILHDQVASMQEQTTDHFLREDASIILYSCIQPIRKATSFSFIYHKQCFLLSANTIGAVQFTCCFIFIIVKDSHSNQRTVVGLPLPCSHRLLPFTAIKKLSNSKTNSPVEEWKLAFLSFFFFTSSLMELQKIDLPFFN